MSRLLGRPITAEELPGIRADSTPSATSRKGSEGICGMKQAKFEKSIVTNSNGKDAKAYCPAWKALSVSSAKPRSRNRPTTDRTGHRPPESIEETAGNIERESPLFRGQGPQGELYSGIHPRVLIEGSRVLQRAWKTKSRDHSSTALQRSATSTKRRGKRTRPSRKACICSTTHDLPARESRARGSRRHRQSLTRTGAALCFDGRCDEPGESAHESF